MPAVDDSDILTATLAVSCVTSYDGHTLIFYLEALHGAVLELMLAAIQPDHALKHPNI